MQNKFNVLQRLHTNFSSEWPEPAKRRVITGRPFRLFVVDTVRRWTPVPRRRTVCVRRQQTWVKMRQSNGSSQHSAVTGSLDDSVSITHSTTISAQQMAEIHPVASIPQIGNQNRMQLLPPHFGLKFSPPLSNLSPPLGLLPLSWGKFC